MSDFLRVKDLLKHFTEIGPAGCAISIHYKGENVLTHYEGFADLETQKPIQEDTIFRMFSNSKPVTIVAALQLYERGLFLLNDPISKYLPEYESMFVGHVVGNNRTSLQLARNPIRIKDLMTMSSGLTYGGNSTNISRTHGAIGEITEELEARGHYTTREYARRLAEVPLLFEPGTSWSYGASHDVLGAVIEVISGQSLGDYMKEHIFDPLDMKDTSFFITEEKRARLATVYTLEGLDSLVPNLNLDDKYETSHEFQSGGAGLLSTLGDMSKFANMLASGGKVDEIRIIGRKTIDLMRKNHLKDGQMKAYQEVHENQWDSLMGYGYGLGVRTMVDCTIAGSNGSVGEFGWMGAAGTYMLIDPSEELAVIYMHQLAPENLECYCQPRLRATIFSCID